MDRVHRLRCGLGGPTARPGAAPPTTSGASVVSSAAGAVAREKSPVPKSAMAKPKAKPGRQGLGKVWGEKDGFLGGFTRIDHDFRVMS